MKNFQIIDLSHKLHPGKEEYKLEMKRYFVDELFPQYSRRPEDWYILHEITFITHVGTHVEVPQHYLKNGKDTVEMPLEKLVGEAVIIDFTHKKVREAIDVADFEKHRRRIREGDIVFLRTGLSKYYNTPYAHDRPYLTNEAVKWLVAKKIHCLGVDCTGIEPKGWNYQPNHETLFLNDIPLVEYLTNLDQIEQERFLVFILPLPIVGMEASPVRVIAIVDTGISLSRLS